MLMENLLRAVYDRSPLLRGAVREYRVRKFARVAQRGAPPFNEDALLADTVTSLMEACGVGAFVETGTYLAHTTRFIAGRFPKVPVTTIEASPVYRRATEVVLRHFPNVRQMEGNSADMLAELLAAGTPASLPMFFLDAHWNEYLPLPEEMRLIGTRCRDAVILIHDFKVPDRPHFRFDTYHGQAIGLELLRPTLQADHRYTVLLPRYSAADVFGAAAAGKPPLRGHCLIFQDADAALATFRASPAGARYGAFDPAAA